MQMESLVKKTLVEKQTQIGNKIKISLAVHHKNA